jgi:restriction system protein
MGGTMAYFDIGHDGLGRYRRLDGANKSSARVTALWEKQWQRRQSAEAASGGALARIKTLQAEEMSEEAEAARGALTSILLDAVRHRQAVDWSAYIDRREYAELPPTAPAKLSVAREPQQSDARFAPVKHSFLARVFRPSRLQEQKETAAAGFEAAHQEWQLTTQWHMSEHTAASARYDAALADWDARKGAYYAAQERANARIEDLRARYDAHEPGAVAAACDLALLAMPRPEGFAKFWRIDLHPAGALRVDYDLPAPDALAALRSVKYDAERNAFAGTMLSARETAVLYEEAMYQTALAVCHLMFAADSDDAVRTVVFNGWVNHIDRRQVCPARACLLALRVGKADFKAIDLTAVDPKTCFRQLGGAAGQRLADLESVEPAGWG